MAADYFQDCFEDTVPSDSSDYSGYSAAILAAGIGMPDCFECSSSSAESYFDGYSEDIAGNSPYSDSFAEMTDFGWDNFPAGMHCLASYFRKQAAAEHYTAD